MFEAQLHSSSICKYISTNDCKFHISTISHNVVFLLFCKSNFSYFLFFVVNFMVFWIDHWASNLQVLGSNSVGGTFFIHITVSNSTSVCTHLRCRCGSSAHRPSDFRLVNSIPNVVRCISPFRGYRTYPRSGYFLVLPIWQIFTNFYLKTTTV